MLDYIASSLNTQTLLVVFAAIAATATVLTLAMPIVFADPSKANGLWEPKNDDDKFEGPMRLREALVESKNLVSVRLLDAIGVRYAREYATRFGFSLQQLPDNLSFALGTASVLAAARAVHAEGFDHVVMP